METSTQVGTYNVSGRVGVGAGGVGEVRKIHIVYFISRLGRIEHPHLIRVNHVSNRGIRLRDVKRWLSELRGKDMSESYSWSYKRKYKAGYVWQDLLDDDLITPISDNEYVLKGSEIPSSRIGVDPTGEKKPSGGSTGKESPEKKTEAMNLKQETHPIKKSSSEIDEESPPFSSNASTITEDSIRTEEDSIHFKSNKPNNNQEQSSNLETPSSSSLYSMLFQKKNKTKNTRNNDTSSFRNWIRCGNVENQESAVVTISRRKKKETESDGNARLECGSTSCRSSADVGNRSSTDKLLGSCSQRILRSNPEWEKTGFFNTRSSLDSKKQEETAAQRLKPGFYRYGPNCSQCGKKFKPHKLQSHMKSCKGMKDLSSRISSNKLVDEPIYKPSSCGLYLTLEAP